jgi:PAS domain-containing protein
VQGVGWDITERYAMEEQLRQSELKLRTLFQRSNDFLFLTDETGRIPIGTPLAKR